VGQAFSPAKTPHALKSFLIDIHSHVLYGLDDGARTLEDSVAMIRMAADNGTTDLVCTPHANLTYRFEPDRIRERLAEISEASGNVLRLYSGCDFHLSYENIQDAIENPRKYTIDHQNYLLVEFSDLLIFRNTAEILARLQDAGMIPVLTHPERNGLLRQRIDQIEAWVQAGARVQITAQSPLGDFGRRAKEFCETLLDRGLVHFVASDAHDCERRTPRLDQAYAWLKQDHGEAIAEALCVANPRAALNGEPLETEDEQDAVEPRKWYQLWRS
jgi:protein-tyrosine phosphatase